MESGRLLKSIRAPRNIVVSGRDLGMGTVFFVLASVAPAVFLALRAAAFRHRSQRLRLAVDLIILIASLPIGLRLTSAIVHLPADAGDHNPGTGVAFLPLSLVWLFCLVVWLVRAAALAFASRRSED